MTFESFKGVLYGPLIVCVCVCVCVCVWVTVLLCVWYLHLRTEVVGSWKRESSSGCYVALQSGNSKALINTQAMLSGSLEVNAYSFK